MVVLCSLFGPAIRNNILGLFELAFFCVPGLSKVCGIGTAISSKGPCCNKNACSFTLNALGAWLLHIQVTEKDTSKNEPSSTMVSRSLLFQK